MDKQWRGKGYQGLVFTVLLMICLMVLQGCGKNTEEKSSSQETSKGRYVEQQVSFENGYLLAMTQLKDGKIRIITETGIYDSGDEGKTWNPWESMPKELKEDFEKSAVTNAEVSRTGSILWESGEIYKLMTPDGNIRQLEQNLMGDETGDLDIRLWGVFFTDSGDILLAGDRLQKIYYLDGESLSVKHVYDLPIPGENNFLQRDICTMGDKIYVMDAETQIQQDGRPLLKGISSRTFSLSNFEEEGGLKPLEQFLIDGKLEWPDFKLFKGNGDNLYLAGQDGIYRWHIDGTAVEKIFEGEQGQMFSEHVSMGTVTDNGTILLSYPRITGADIICRYHFDPEAPLQPDKSLTVYSLYENQRIRQAITAFQRGRTDVSISYEVGISGSDGITRSDALKTLNTNIMADDGPDLLLLEGMPLQAYLEKGILLDISDVIKKAASGDGLFENITGAYQADGGIYAVPTYFSLPVLLGKENLLSKAGTLEELAAVAEEQRAAYPETANILGDMTQAYLLRGLMPSSSPAWIKEDGTLDREKILQFLEAAKRISDAQGPPAIELINDIEPDNEVFERTPFMNDIAYIASSIGFSNAELAMGNLSREEGLSQIVSMATKLGDSTYKPFPGQAGNVFSPLEIVGISARSKEPDTAKEFLSYLLGEGQYVSGMPGWPVNKAAFESLEEKPQDFKEGWINPVNDVDGSTYEIERIWPSKDEFQNLKELIATLKTPAVTDEMINRTVLRYGVKCLKGEQTPSEAADAITTDVNLYLAE